MTIAQEAEWENLTPEERKRKLYEQQKATLDTFLVRGSISKAQYDKSLGDLTVKMGYGNKAASKKPIGRRG